MHNKKSKPQNEAYIVGIGASAGGLDALNLLFQNIPHQTGFSFIIVQHLSPDHKSLMAELLSKHTSMQVMEATDGIALEADCVYLLPSKKFMEVKAGRLRLFEKDKGPAPNNAIDIFFESLAAEYGARAVGIVLSGTGSDGTRGLQAIHQGGGITIAQDPASAAFTGMPNSAIGSGIVNMVLSPQAMAADLLDFISSPHPPPSSYQQLQYEEAGLYEIIELIKKTGQDFSYYKHPTLVRRLAKRMSEMNIAKLSDYVQYLHSHPDEIKALSQEFLINVTHFFRDKEAFAVLRETVIPELLKDKQPGSVIKLWVIACSTGEEAYSLAMLFKEHMHKEKLADITVKIFATDVDRDALQFASAGIYSRNLLEAVPGQFVAKYFDIENDKYRVKPELRKMVLFSHHDIMKDPPFGRMDLISCRNFLIYIKQDIQKDILRKIHFALNINGYLFAGPSEYVDSIKASLEEVDKKWRIYKCKSKQRSFDADSLFPAFQKTPFLPSARLKNPGLHLGELMKETLLEDKRYAGLLVDMNFDVKQALGSYKHYIQFPESGFNFNLLKMALPDLSAALGIALRKAVKENHTVINKNVKLPSENGWRHVNVIVKPFLTQSDYQHQFLFIVLNDGDVAPSEQPATSLNALPEAERVLELEADLKETRESLQAIIEEMEATNEELQSANEEMVSANEELQSTNEELQSLNEELHTVSTEHQAKIKELIELNDDLNNYFRNSEIGQLLVDRSFVIRKFSPSATKMINLIPTDINRSIIDITTRFKEIDFIGDITAVMSSGQTLEKEIQVRDSIYAMKISPYEKQDKTLDGVVINFIDVTHMKRMSSLVEATFRSLPNAILASKAVRNAQRQIVDFEFVMCNEAAEQELNLERKDVIGKTLKTVLPSKYKDTLKLYASVVESGTPYTFDRFNNKQQKWGNVILAKMLDGVVSVTTDINESKLIAELVQKNYEELRQSLKIGKRSN